MERLNIKQEQEVKRFHCHLRKIETVDDIFPPSGVLEPLPPPVPGKPSTEGLCLAAVYDICVARQRRDALQQTEDALLENISALIDA